MDDTGDWGGGGRVSTDEPLGAGSEKRFGSGPVIEPCQQRW